MNKMNTSNYLFLCNLLDDLRLRTIDALRTANVPYAPCALTEEERGDLFRKGVGAINDAGIELGVDSDTYDNIESIIATVHMMKRAHTMPGHELPDFVQAQYKEILRLSDILDWYRVCVRQLGEIG